MGQRTVFVQIFFELFGPVAGYCASARKESDPRFRLADRFTGGSLDCRSRTKQPYVPCCVAIYSFRKFYSITVTSTGCGPHHFGGRATGHTNISRLRKANT
eukprot:TRINITY_DN8331_c0_g1_i1.p3 TRINITY_DN8331_c0_g1~~TRINITY_DN8331_c0_g1_i1.p3  ORF type:complete len:101 (-),score=2.66 TRINITY_DN8331_c0_g1_i1:623-925(-)